jgi:hypothetical protein
MVKQSINYNEYIELMLYSNIFKLENTLIKTNDKDLYVENNVSNLFEIKLKKKQIIKNGIVKNNIIDISDVDGKLINVIKLELFLNDGIIEIDFDDNDDFSDGKIDLTPLGFTLDDIKYNLIGEFLF